MSYKNRTQRIFANLNLQTNLIGGKPKVGANITETQPETTANKELNLSQNNVSDFMPECILKPSNTMSGNLQTTLHVNEEHLSEITPSGNFENNFELSQKSSRSSSSSSTSDSSSSSSTSSSSSSDTSSSDSEHEPFGSDDSVKDPTYNSSLSNDEASSEEKENNKVTKKRKVMDPCKSEKKSKKRSRNPDMWHKNVAKRLRNSGESYIGLSTEKNEDGNQIKIKIKRPQKALQPPRGEKCKLKCSLKIVEEERLKIFNEYWGLKDLEKQRQFISSNMQTVNPRYKYSNAATPRNPNNAYYFIIGDNSVRVCKHFFIATLAINNRVIQTVLKKQKVCQSGKIVEVDKRGKHNNHYKVDQQIKNEIREHIKSIPRIDSHYCRSHTSKEYIEGSKTLADLHRDYLKICEEKNLPVGNYHIKTNAIFVCNLRIQLKRRNKVFLEKYERHIKEKELSRKEKENDKKNGENTYVIVFDLQAVLPCPVGDASSFFYVSKLNVLNFTFYDIKSKQGTCYLWHEAEAQRGSNEIGTCIYKYLENIRAVNQERDLNIIFYSDNCAGQNKNKFLIALYLYALFKFDITSITHKFLITGHSQNEGDSVHATIEKAIKKYKKSSPIYVPDQYACIIRSAKKNEFPYKVNELCFKDVVDLKKLTSDLFLNVPKNIKISELKTIKVDKKYPNHLFFKTSFEETDFNQAEILSSRKNIDITKIEIKNAYVRKPGITEEKKKGIISLIEKKKCVPMYYLDFYNNL
ncbi:hypothetical protein NQ314_005405 [Rhamnusium bicolor]|uniref:DUF7869 domain-containing protein n=1 Tax=Rhamnusium bicolor TaxID=1586634 RepID=A0AAV8ZJI4_9CUCU|nr:hypothetical protein NQ314_005405 [Rhamnusium bicolor]